MIFLSANNASAVLAVSADAFATSLELFAGTGDLFPSPGPDECFPATLGSNGDLEIVWVIARDGDSVTVVRGREGTTARAWPEGSSFQNRVTKAQLDNLVQEPELEATVGQIAGQVTVAEQAAVDAQRSSEGAAAGAGVAATSAEQAARDAADAKAAAEIAIAAVGVSSLSNVVIDTTPVFIDGVGYCPYVIVDQTDKPISVIDAEGVTWVLDNGSFISLSAAEIPDTTVLQTVSVELPNVGYASVIFVDKDDKPFAAYGGDGSSWSLENGVLTRTGSGGGSGPQTYLGGAAFTDIYGARMQNWLFSDPNIIIMILIVGQSLAIGSNPDQGATFLGSISGTVLILEGAVSGQIVLRQGISGTGVTSGTKITGYKTFAVTPSQTVASATFSTPSGSFTGSIAAGVLTIESAVTGNVCAGQIVTGTGVAADTRLGDPLSYTVDTPQTVASTTITVAKDTARTTMPTYPDNVLMFGLTGESYGRVRPDGASVDRFVPCVEADVGGGDVESGYIKESVCTTFGNTLFEQFQTHTGFSPTFLMAIAGSGGTPYPGMTRGTPNGDEARRLVQAGVEIAAAQGKKIVVMIQHAIEGEADNAAGVQAYPYAREMCQWQSHGSTDYREITGQAEPVRMTLSQCNRRADSIRANSRTPYGALLSMKLSPMLCCVGPIYDVLPDSTQTHPYSYGYIKMGARAGYAAFAEIFGVGYQPLEAIGCYWASATELRVQYNRPVTVDKSNSIVNGTLDDVNTNCGFSFQDGTLTPPTITSVASVSSDTIAVTLSGVPATYNVRLIYASYSSQASMGYRYGARGFVRATASWGNVPDGNALNNQAAVYDWACTQTITPGMTVF